MRERPPPGVRGRHGSGRSRWFRDRRGPLALAAERGIVRVDAARLAVPQKCKGRSSEGGLCGSSASAFGFCANHVDQAPGSTEDRETLKLSLEKAERRLNDVIGCVVTTAEARGWSWTLDSVDERDWHFASVSVFRETPNADEVNGICEISVDSGVRIPVTKTSFHGYGLVELQEGILKSLYRLPWLEKPRPKAGMAGSSRDEHLERLLRRFHTVARQLRRRYDDRPTLEINDEYDVQDLLHALLKIEFEDVRPEEVAPSHAGASSRMDFLLKAQKVVVEAKMASAKLRDKQIGEQLIIDIERYQSHPSCDRLVCLVYDPEDHIRNPAGLENDLSGKRGRIDVKVIVVSG
jgi:REase_DpnII-MboI